jgi:hypothetical protein
MAEDRAPTSSPSADPAGTTVVITVGGPPGVFGPDLINMLEHGAQRVEVIHRGLTRFSGTPAELAALVFIDPDIAGESSLERSLRLISQDDPTPTDRPVS